MLEVRPRRRAGFAGTRPVYAFPLRYDRQKLRLWLAGVVLPAAPAALGVRTLYSTPAIDFSGRTTGELFPWCWMQTGTAYSPNKLLPPGLTLAGAALLALVWSAITGQRDLKSKAVARSTAEAAASELLGGPLSLSSALQRSLMTAWTIPLLLLALGLGRFVRKVDDALTPLGAGIFAAASQFGQAMRPWLSIIMNTSGPDRLKDRLGQWLGDERFQR
jgi:putative exporter of polyketide antibiotics